VLVDVDLETGVAKLRGVGNLDFELACACAIDDDASTANATPVLMDPTKTPSRDFAI
jgi:hypothetical protein